MDELLLDAAVESSPHREEIRRVFAESPPWRSFCEFKARRLKEKYFSDEAYWKDRDCLETVTIVIEGEGSSGSHAAEETSSGAGSGNGKQNQDGSSNLLMNRAAILLASMR